MASRSEKARQALMDAAEELYALHGVEAVSNRAITEHAGSANHSAVAYHFGTRDGLISALLRRHMDEVGPLRTARIERLDDDADLRALIACWVLPHVHVLRSTPAPAWRARFLYQLRTLPSADTLIREAMADADDPEALTARMSATLGDLPRGILHARAQIAAGVLLGVCAEFERLVALDDQKGSWEEVGIFLIDAIAGMIAAPVSPGGHYDPPRSPLGI